MGVNDGQAVDAAVTNPAFINKNQNDVMPNQLGFTRSLSGASIADIQAAVNKLYNASGASESTSGTTYNATPGTIANGDSYQTALTRLSGKFSPTTGHFHTGAQGDGPILSASSISNTPGTPFPVASAGVIGGSASFAWSNHQHAGVHSIAASGHAQVLGDAILVAGPNVTLSQSGQNITIAAVSGGGGGLIAPTVQTFSASSGTYTTPAGVLYLRVRMVGGGGGGSGSGTASVGNGGNGTNTTFGSSFLTAFGGNGSVGSVTLGGTGGLGGTASSAVASSISLSGSDGQPGGAAGAVAGTRFGGGNGGSNSFGGGSRGGQPGSDGVQGNNGQGAGGGGGGGAPQGSSGGGGGAGGYVDAIIVSPSPSYSFSVGSGGSGGSNGTSGNAGGPGGSGFIIVEEFYQ